MLAERFHETASSAAIEHLRWSLTPRVGPVLFGRLIERFGSAQAALGASAGQLAEIDGIGQTTADNLARERDTADVLGEVELAARHEVRIFCREDEGYPPLLRHLPDPPICLYVRGRLEPEDGVAVAIVGARRCSTYGREQARRFGYQLASNGLTVVSGLARGIDGESHKGALQAGGRTVAVLGNGLARLYPPEHADLAAQICRQGAVVSELPMSSSPEAKNFLPRNRLIAGLSLGVLVIEAARRSGSLTTARLATEYDREVFALPGRVDQESAQGTNGLIRDQHAKLVTCIGDILSELGQVGEILGVPEVDTACGAQVSSSLPDGLSDRELAVLETLSRDERSVEQIAGQTDQPAAHVAAALITLQLRGLARQLPGNLFVRIGR